MVETRQEKMGNLEYHIGKYEKKAKIASSKSYNTNREWKEATGYLYIELNRMRKKLIKLKVKFALVNKILRKNFPGDKSKSSKTGIRGYRRTGAGYIVTPPSDFSDDMIIDYHTSYMGSPERFRKIHKQFNDKLKPLLKENGVKFTMKDQEIIIKKQ